MARSRTSTWQVLWRAVFLFAHCQLVLSTQLDRRQSPSVLPNSTIAGNTTALNISSSEIQAAEQLLNSAVAQQGVYNAYRVAHPRRNRYTRAPSSKKRDTHADEPKPPELSDKLRAAAALIAERDARQRLSNGTQSPDAIVSAASRLARQRRAAAADESDWVPLLAAAGLPPMGYDPSYKVFRDVTAYGAKGDGVTDDTEAINKAIADGGNCGANCLSSSVKGTLIYFPPGTYLISTPINAYYYTQLVGHANDVPIIQTSKSFMGLGAIQTDVYYPDGHSSEWYINQSVFFRQVRNFLIDITGTTTANVAGLHWQVAQATSLINVVIMASDEAGDGNTQIGMFTENGSGGFMSDVQIFGGAYGIYGGNQQYTVRNFEITGQTTACICLLWDWGWTWSGLKLMNAPIGISLINPDDPDGQSPGSIYLMDSLFFNTAKGIVASFNKTILDSSIITLDNINVLGDVNSMISYADGTVVEVPPGDIKFVIVGDIEDQGQAYGSYSYNAPDRPASLVSDAVAPGRYFVKSRPTYSDMKTSAIISVKSTGAKGDGHTDDTAAVQAAFGKATTDNLIYFPPGSYIITSTLQVPRNIRLTGSVWSQLVASGSFFQNAASPKPMLQVGKPGDLGTVEISDMLFTSVGALPGLILVEWNIAAAFKGSVGIWDSHLRLGGAYGTNLQVGQCPLQDGLPSQCVAANTMLHITSQANGYFENMWAWVADHDLDDATNAQVGIASARGILIESQGPTWFYGTASEHSMLYQYSFVNSAETFAGMIQTESPYFQATDVGQSPGPFKSSLGSFPGDPTFEAGSCNGTDLRCHFPYGLMASNTTNLTIAGAGLYSWFGNYIQSCIDSQDCQQQMVWDNGDNSGFALYNLITIGSAEMVSGSGLSSPIMAKEHTQSIGHPFWSALAAYLDSSEKVVLSCAEDDTSSECLDYSTCDTKRSFSSWDDLDNASLEDECVPYAAMNTLDAILLGAAANYSAANNGYDKVFGYYQEYMRDLLPDVLSSLFTGAVASNPKGGAGNAFFSCTGSGDLPAQTQSCPIPSKDMMVATGYGISYALTDETGWNNLLKSKGIDPSWVEYVTLDLTKGSKGSCSGSNKDVCFTDKRELFHFPQIKSGVNIPNPKDIVAATLANLTNLQNDMAAIEMDMLLGGWDSSMDDPLQAYSMPVLFLQQSIDNMEYAKAKGQVQQKQDKIDLVVKVLSGVFAVLPFLDEVAPALGLLGGVASAVAALGSTGLTIYDIVENPTDAPMAILGLVLGSAGGVRAGARPSEEDVAGIANARRGLKDGDLTKIGDDFKAQNGKFENAIRQKCEI